MTVKIKVINNKNQNMKYKDNNLQIQFIICLAYLHNKRTCDSDAEDNKMVYQEGYLKCDVFDEKTMDINH
jgi:hypothetical protein